MLRFRPIFGKIFPAARLIPERNNRPRASICPNHDCGPAPALPKLPVGFSDTSGGIRSNCCFFSQASNHASNCSGVIWGRRLVWVVNAGIRGLLCIFTAFNFWLSLICARCFFTFWRLLRCCCANWRCRFLLICCSLSDDLPAPLVGGLQFNSPYQIADGVAHCMRNLCRWNHLSDNQEKLTLVPACHLCRCFQPSAVVVDIADTVTCLSGKVCQRCANRVAAIILFLCIHTQDAPERFKQRRDTQLMRHAGLALDHFHQAMLNQFCEMPPRGADGQPHHPRYLPERRERALAQVEQEAAHLLKKKMLASRQAQLV